jgi:hypothetical protein
VTFVEGGTIKKKMWDARRTGVSYICFEDSDLSHSHRPARHVRQFNLRRSSLRKGLKVKRNRIMHYNVIAASSVSLSHHIKSARIDVSGERWLRI